MLRLIRNPLLIGWVLGLATAGLIAATIGALILFGGVYNVRADRAHGNLAAWAIHRSMISSIKRHADPPMPQRPVTPEVLLAGAKAYEAHCIACHGGPGVSRAPWASAMLPSPPFLIDAHTRWSREQLHALIGGGVKMTAMPAWNEILPPQELDDLVDFVRAMPLLSAERYRRIREILRAQPTTQMEASGPAASLAPQPFSRTRPADQTVQMVDVPPPR